MVFNGRFLPERKNSDMLEDALLVKYRPINRVASMYAAMINQSISDRFMVFYDSTEIIFDIP